MKKNQTHFRDGAVVLYKRERSNNYQARIKIGKGKGSWKRIATGFSDLEQASDFACDKYDEQRFRVKSGLAPDSRTFKRVAEIAKKELREELDAGYGKIVYSDYIQAIDKYMIPFFKAKHIDSLNYITLQEFDNHRKELLGKYPAKSTVNTHNAALRRVFAVAVKNNWMSDFQVPAIINTGRKEQAQRRAYFTREEYRILCRHLRKFANTGRKQQTRDIRTLLRDYVLIVANTGMRPGTETVNLRWNDISEFQAADGKKYLRMIVSGKTGEREIIARHGVRRFLRRIASGFEELENLENGDLYEVDEFVFRLRDGSGLNRSTLNNSFKQCLQQCGLLYNTKGKIRTLYSLRHTYATFQLLNNISIHILARQMGTSVGMIEKHYSHLVPTLSAELLGGKYR